ncbi:MAG: hypothetical protein F6K10_27100 [Moorea sp. SIO2B7]|nr:hypothetical protein [Moorena sp. SIO2B7]
MVDPHWFQGSSYLKIGWSWVKTALTQGWELFQTLVFNGRPDPSPAIAENRMRKRGIGWSLPYSERIMRFLFFSTFLLSKAQYNF